MVPPIEAQQTYKWHKLKGMTKFMSEFAPFGHLVQLLNQSYN